MSTITRLKEAQGFGFQIENKSVVLDGGAGSGAVGTIDLFTVTGMVIARVVAVVIAGVTQVAAGTISVGIAGATAAITAVTSGTKMAAGEIWHDATPDAEIEALTVLSDQIISDGNDIIATVAGANATDGELQFVCIWVPLTADGDVVAA